MMPAEISVPDFVAVYAAALSTVLLLLEIQRRRPKLSLRIANVYQFGGLVDFPKQIGVEIGNRGELPITISSAGVGIDRRRLMQIASPIDFKFPCSIEPGNGVLVRMEAAQMSSGFIEKQLLGSVRVRAWCRDATGRLHWGQSAVFRVSTGDIHPTRMGSAWSKFRP